MGVLNKECALRQPSLQDILRPSNMLIFLAFDLIDRLLNILLFWRIIHLTFSSQACPGFAPGVASF
jgi:hypothetical protein